jgi:ribosome-associated toxin RatA of RatAB toxin-antitoxin module
LKACSEAGDRIPVHPAIGGLVPTVETEFLTTAPIDAVWSAVQDVEAFPEYMQNVESVEVLGTDESGCRITRWSVLLKGSPLEWTERERVDAATRTLRFDQVDDDGDLEVFNGAWQVTPAGEGVVRVKLSVTFEIGIPLLADMLNPVAARAVRENSEQMLHAIEEQASVGAR